MSFHSHRPIPSQEPVALFSPSRAQGSSLRPATASRVLGAPSRSRARRPAPLDRPHPPGAANHDARRRPAGPGRHCGGGRAPRARLRSSVGRRLARVPYGGLRGQGGGAPRLFPLPFRGHAARRVGCGRPQGLGQRRIREVGNAGAMIALIYGLMLCVFVPN